LVSMVGLGHKREVELRVLLLIVVTNKTALNFLVVHNFMHLDRHVIDFVVDCDL